jgi:GntR family transcriptional regulator
MLHFQINPHTGVPVYRQLMDQIKYYVSSDSLKPGDQLPSIREMAKTLAVNPTTIVKAYSELQHSGIIEMRHGKGVFVSENHISLSDKERKEILHRLASHLVFEAKQMAAPDRLVVQVVEEELKVSSNSKRTHESLTSNQK